MADNIADKFRYLIETKEEIRKAIEAKGVDIAGDTVFRDYAQKISEISGGGSGSEEPDSLDLHNVRYIRVMGMDYDGTVFFDKYYKEGSEITLPEPPTHSDMVFEGYDSPAYVNPDTRKTVVECMTDLFIFTPRYGTVSGFTEITVTLTGSTAVPCNMDGEKDWGDGVIDETTSHTYAEAGTYTIICKGTKITGNFISGSSATASSTISEYKYHFMNLESVNSATSATVPSSKVNKLIFSKTCSVIPTKAIGTNNLLFLFTPANTGTSVSVPSFSLYTYGTALDGTNGYSSTTSQYRQTTSAGYPPESYNTLNYNIFNQMAPFGVSLKGITEISSGGSLYFGKIIDMDNLNWTSNKNVYPRCEVYLNMPANLTVFPVLSSVSYADALLGVNCSSVNSVPSTTSLNVDYLRQSITKIYIPEDLYEVWTQASYWSTLKDKLIPVPRGSKPLPLKR